MPLLTDYNNSQDTNFQYRVAEAIVATAIAIQSEAVTTANHAQRSAYALLVLANPSGYARLMAPGFTADKDNDAGACDLTATDAQLKNRASAIWNAYSVQT